MATNITINNGDKDVRYSLLDIIDNKIKVDGFIGIASDLVKYDKKYYNIII